MSKIRFKSIIMACTIFVLASNKCFSQNAFTPLVPRTDNVPDINLTSDELDNNPNFTGVVDKFVQCNIRVSWEDFKNIINTSPENDYIYITLANKMADLGFFDLADLAVSKIKDKELSEISIDAMKRFYYPRKKLKLENELALAEAYSNILYNNQSAEATNDLLQKSISYENSDYANYIIALGSYQSGNPLNAAKYINLAVLQNPTNLNYQKLKAQVLVQNDESEEALKIVANLKKQDLYAYEYETKIKSLEQFILYKTKKQQWEKDYHLGYYYYLENDPLKAIRTLQNALSESRRNSHKGKIYGLMSEIYFKINEFEKASDTAKKAYKINSGNSKALTTLGNLDYMNERYKKAITYYKKAARKDKKSYVPLVQEAKTYQKLSNIKKSKELYVKVLKTHSDSWEAYYNIALLDKNKESTYLKKALAVNPSFKDAWIDLAKVNINTGNYDIAEKYLSNAFNIDENDFRYYYYQGLVNINSGDLNKARYNLTKSLKLNSSFEDAKRALNSLQDKI